MVRQFRLVSQKTFQSMLVDDDIDTFDDSNDNKFIPMNIYICMYIYMISDDSIVYDSNLILGPGHLYGHCLFFCPSQESEDQE